MAFNLEDRVRETSSTAGTGAFTLNGTLEGFRTFGASLADGDTTWYAAVFGAEWEVGLGTFTAPNTLARTTVYRSSNGNSAVSFSAGVKDIFITVPSTFLEALQNLNSFGTAAYKNTGTASGDIPLLGSGGRLATTVLPESVLGGLKYQSGWNASTNSPAIPTASSANQGWYYIVTTAGSTNISGITDWKVGDWIVSNGSSWDKVDNTDQVMAVVGLMGNITAADLLQALGETGSTDVASAATTDIGAATTRKVRITGTTTITSLGTATAGTRRHVLFAGILNLTHNATSLILPSGNTIVTAAGDTAMFISEGSGNWRCHLYQRASGSALVAPAAVPSPAGKQMIPIVAGAMTPRGTNGAPAGSVELATNKIMRVTKDFDTATKEYVQFAFPVPKQLDESATISFRAWWTAASGSGGVAWTLAARATTDDDAIDGAMGTGVTVTDTFITANDAHRTAESGAITIGNSFAEGDMLWFELSREVADAADTLAVDALLIAIELYVTTNAGNDA